jgi:signal transduction histidine kinase
MKKLHYEDLEEMIRDLQTRVEKGITVEQDLINTKNELDAELNRFRLMQKYSSDALKAENLESFGELTVEYFVEIFNLPRVLFLERDENDKQHVLAHFGLEEYEDLLTSTFDKSILANHKSTIVRKGDRRFAQIQKIGLTEAILCPLCDQGDRCTGLVIAGLKKEEYVFYGEIEEKIGDSFSLMTQKVGDHLQILRVNDRLKQGIAEATQELENQAEELKRSNKDLEQFAYVTSHDLKAPLRNIASFVQLLNRKYHDQFDEEAREYMLFILGGVRRLNNLIKDLLQYSRVNRMDIGLEHIDLHDVVDVVKNNLAEEIKKESAQIEILHLPMLRGNYSQMVQLMQNIISNAIKFNNKQIPPIIKIDGKATAKNIYFSVKDNGIGIDPKDTDKVFSIFQRLHSTDEYEGTGIGLSICKRIVERHQGKIWFESEPQKGATFFVQIPKNLKRI